LEVARQDLLRHLLHNKQGLRIAVIVNDVASVNIDSKLIASATDGASGMVELQNGCACCSKSEELLSSVSELVMLSDLKGEELGFHHIVVEMSGVADPKSVRAKFQEAILYDMPLMDRVRLDTMVTVVDCSSFLPYLFTAKSATPNEAPELFYPDGIVPPPQPMDWLDDLPASLREALIAGEAAYSSSSSSSSAEIEVDSGVSELLVSQTETSDVVLLNKIDLAGDDLTQISDVVTALNPRAKVYHTQYGNVDLNKHFGCGPRSGSGRSRHRRRSSRFCQFRPEL
jgi:G3E family GTPase